MGINYTWATNLLKTDDMQTGAVSYKKPGQVKKITIEKNKDLIRKTLKTKEERNPDFQKDYQEYLKELQREENSKNLEEKKAQEEEEKKQKQDKQAKK